MAPFAVTPADVLPGATAAHRGSGFTLLSDGSMILPLDGYDAYAIGADERLVYRAATAVEQFCMRAKGVALPAGYGRRYLPAEVPSQALYGVADLRDAATYGYRIPGSDTPGSTAAGTRIPGKVPAAFYGSRNGAGGCAQQAYTALHIAESQDAFEYVQSLRSQALAGVYQDSLMKAVTAQWSACMKAAGYHYPDPSAPPHDRTLLGRGLPLPEGATLPPPSPLEKKVAAIDVTCKQNGYLRTFAQIAASRQQRLIAENARRLQQVLPQWRDVLRTGSTVLERERKGVPQKGG